ncbi:MAG TPA: hypothetical protein VII75_10415 [Thermoanaerobaculia bacterium]
MNRHYERDELLAYVDRNEAVVDFAEVEAHVATCTACAQRLEEVSADYQILTRAGLWLGRARREPLPSRVAEFVAARQRMEREAARAEIVYAELSRLPLETWIEHLALSVDEYTEGLVRRILNAARDEEERRPRWAGELLAAAETVADLAGLTAASSAETLGDLWKERANVHMIRGDYPGALAAIDRAESFYETRSVAAFNLAFTAWARASVFFEMERYTEAQPLAERAAATFRQFGDEPRETQVRVLIASISYERGSIDIAEAIYRSLLWPLERFGDRLTQARVLANLACCRLLRDDLAMTGVYARRAIAVYREFELETEIIRSRWALAVVYLRRGESERGIEALAAVATEFRDRGLPTDAAEAELQIVEELLKHEEYARAAAIAERLVTTFAAAEARVSTAKALAYLHDAAIRRSATLEMVRAVRHVLVHPEQLFVPPVN